jgi:ubiquitin carboxyl-terminal hydrolase 25/28
MLPSNFEPLDPIARQRVDGIPPGLKNIGNTCYFNSLMQAYYMIPGLVDMISRFQLHETYSDLSMA